MMKSDNTSSRLCDEQRRAVLAQIVAIIEADAELGAPNPCDRDRESPDALADPPQDDEVRP